MANPAITSTDKTVHKTQLNLSIVQANKRAQTKPNSKPKPGPHEAIQEQAPKNNQVAAQSPKVALPSSIDPGPGHIVPLPKATL
jgi:hypothetical protein